MRSLIRNANVPDLVGGVLLLLVGGFFAVGGVEYDLRTAEGQIAPGAMPFLTGVLLAVFGAGVALTGLRPRSARDTPDPDRATATESGTGDLADRPDRSAAPDATGAEPRAPLLRVFALIALTAGAIAAITWFDAYITLAVLMFAVLTVFERVPVWKSAVVSAGVIVACYLIFSVLLNVPLPSIF